MLDRLEKMVQREIGNGLLTGDTGAEVDEYSIAVKAQPETSAK